MTRCGKGLLPECEYYTSAGCVSPFNCPYKVEEICINSATITPDMRIQKYFQGLVRGGVILQEPMNYDAATLKIYIAHLEAENDELKSSLTHANEECLKWHERAQNLLKDSGGSISGYEKKISDLQAENAKLRARLEKAVELPCIEPMTTWDWNEETGIAEKHFGDYYQLLYRDEDGEFICTPGLKKEEAEARLKELKGEI